MSKYEWFHKEEVIENEVDFAMRILNAIKEDEGQTIGFIFSEEDFCSSRKRQKEMRDILKILAIHCMEYDIAFDDHIKNVDMHIANKDFVTDINAEDEINE